WGELLKAGDDCPMIGERQAVGGERQEVLATYYTKFRYSRPKKKIVQPPVKRPWSQVQGMGCAVGRGIYPTVGVDPLFAQSDDLGRGLMSVEVSADDSRARSRRRRHPRPQRRRLPPVAPRPQAQVRRVDCHLPRRRGHDRAEGRPPPQ